MRPLRILAVAVTLAAANDRISTQQRSPTCREFERIRLVRLSEVVKDIPAIYARHLNAEDMRVLAAFYGTATGTKMLQAMPKVLPEAFASVLPRTQPMMAETQDSFLRLLRERGLLN
jgi:hypothetical protein